MSRETNFYCFHQLRKSSYKVSWPKLFEILKKRGIKDKYRRIITSQYRDQKAVVEMQGEREEVSIRKGVRQGCSLLSPLFNLYSEEDIDEIKEETKNTGVKFQGKTIKMLRFADYIALLANTEIEIEEASIVTEAVFNNCNMKINIGKTKLIACRTKSGKKRLKIETGNEQIAEIDEFCYLGSKITRDGRCNADIRSE